MDYELTRLNFRSRRIKIAIAILVVASISLGAGANIMGLEHPRWLLMLFVFDVALVILAISIARTAARLNYRTIWLDYHFCPDCGYDLRASPDRCPECGFLVPTKDASTEATENTEGTEQKHRKK